MLAPDLYVHFLRRLNATGIRYMITGGLAAIIYGEPRLTNDVDIVIVLGPEDADRLVAAFQAPGYYAPPLEVVREEAARPAWGHFNVLHVDTALRADVYPLGDDPLGAWAMERRWEAPVADETVWVAPIEYVILMKLIYFRDGGSDRHLRDISAMVRISGETIDQPALESWLNRLLLHDEWTRARSYGAKQDPT
ncbi:MAG: nucleotidyl transferase AbiEii/AbiGii toxin family protein [Gemmatimonadaceae bacterium]